MALDPASPRARVVVPLVIAAASMLGPFAIDTAYPAFEAIGSDFGASTASMQLVVSAYLFAFALMSPFHGPLSDALGRKPVMVGGILAFAAASAGCALAPSLAVLLVFRVLQGLSAGGGVIVSRTVIRDLYDGAQAQRLMSTVMMIFGLAPAVAPIVGAGLLALDGWPVIFAFLAVFGVALAALVWFVLPESHPVERRRALSLREILSGLGRVSGSVAFERLAWGAGLAFAGWFVYVGGAAIVVFDLLHKGSGDFWMLFVPLIGGIVLGSFVSGRAAGRIEGRRLVQGGLSLVVVAGVLNVVVAALDFGLPWVVLAPSLMSFGVAMTYPTIQLALLDMFPLDRGAAASGAAFVQLVLNAVIAAAVIPLVSGSLTGLALLALGLAVAGFGLWTWHDRATSRPMPEPPAETAPPTAPAAPLEPALMHCEDC